LNYETTKEIELALALFFDKRKNIIVPNVSYGMFKYELDLCILDCAGFYAKEVEIKISKSDLKADNKKKHRHENNMIKYLYFAMPYKMKDCEGLVPENAGILLITEKGKVITHRKPKTNKNAKKWEYKDAYKLARLGVMRFWNLRMKEK
jgi:hypothetical protein